MGWRIIKPFSIDLYNKNDDAKELVIQVLQDKGFKAWVNPDTYGIDIICQRNDEPYTYYEVEVKHNWKGESFPFKSIHIPMRKLKFANARSYFVMLNHERSHMLVIPGIQLLNSPVITKSTIYTNNEMFIEVKINAQFDKPC
jgi:hypothetical protein